MTGQSVLLHIEEGVATITLNRPEVFNAVDPAMGEAMVRAIQACAEEGIRAVLLTGAGRGFCAGGDMKTAMEYIRSGGRAGHFFRDMTVLLHRAIVDIRLLEKPVVAAINGAAGGAGISLAAACDLRLAAESARFKQAYTSIGLVPDGGWTAIVPLLIGPGKASEMLLLDPVLDARQALALGLVNEVAADEMLAQRSREVAASLAQGPTVAFAGAKTLLNSALFPALEAQLERERQRIIAQSGTADFLEGMTAFLEKRAPRFRGE